MHYVYVLRGIKDGDLYVGRTHDLRKRLKMHNLRRVHATKRRVPLELIYYEAFVNQQDAFSREKWFKTGWGHNQLYKILFNYLKI